jgi:metallo-beta-lactamase family protein
MHTLGGFSAHVGRTDLLNWFSVIAPSKPRVVAHRWRGLRHELAGLHGKRHGLKSVMPMLGDVVEL